MRALAFAAALAALLAVVPPASARSHKRCAISGVEVWGCLRSRRRPVLVASASRDQYSSSSIDAIALDGRFVAYTLSGGVIDGTCQAGVTVFSLARRQAKW